MRAQLILLLVGFAGLNAVAQETPVPITRPSREVSVELNPFLYKCVGTEPLPQVREVRISFDRSHAQELITNFTFRADSEPQLVNKSRLLSIRATDNGDYHVSLVGPAVRSSFTVILKTPNGRIQYRFDSNPEHETGTVHLLLSKKQKSEICLKNQIWAGMGFSMFNYQQQIQSINANMKFTSTVPGSSHLEGRWYPNKYFGVIASYKNAPGVLNKGNIQGINETQFNWRISEVGVQIRRPSWFFESNGLIVYPYLRTSLEHHQIGRLGATKDEDLFFDNLKFVDGTFGIGANVFTSKTYFMEFYLSAKRAVLQDGSQVQSVGIPFTGAVGVGRSFADRFLIGVYWYGHSERISYQSEKARDPNPGQLDVFFSNFDLRLGYMF